MKNKIRCAITSFLVFLLTSLHGYWGHEVKFIGTSLLYCCMSWYLLDRTQEWKTTKLFTISAILLPFLVFLLPVHILNFSHTTVALFSSFAYLIGVIIGVLVYYSGKLFKMVYLTFLISINIFAGVAGFSYWINYINFGTWTKETNQELPHFVFTAEDGKMITDKDIKGKIVILDFWNTRCGVCLAKFPILEKEYLKYKSNANMELFAVNVPFKNDNVGKSVSKIRSKGYTFPVLKAGSSDVEKEFKIMGYPTVIIINKELRVIYKGEIENIDEIINRELKKQ